MTKSIKIILKVIFSFILAISCSCIMECQENYSAPWRAVVSPVETQGLVIPSPPSKGSLSYSSYYDYISVPQAQENIFFTKNTYNKTEFNKNETIRVILAVINKRSSALPNVTIEDQIVEPFKLARDTYIITRDNTTFTKPAPRSGPIKIVLGKLNRSSSAYIEYMITTDIANNGYVLPSAILSVNLGIWDGNKNFQSVPVYINIIDRTPIIQSLQVTPNPVQRDIITGKLNNGIGVQIKAAFEDSDKSDLERVELWSSLDGIIDRAKLKSSSNIILTNFNYSKYLYNLSKGYHKLTLKVYDKDNRYASEIIELDVKNYLWIFPWEYAWVIIAAILTTILLEIIKLVHKKSILPIITDFSLKQFYIKNGLASKWNDKGLKCLNLGQSQKAIESFEKAIEINPNYAEAWNNKGRVLYSTGKYKEAIRCSRKAIDIDHAYSAAWLNIGNILNDLGREEANAYLFMAKEKE